jgi:hypothetical protein
MRIISKFHDYYDSAMGYGVDMTQVLVRKNEIISNTSGIVLRSDIDFFRNSLKMIIVGFCGKYYIIFSMKEASVFHDTLYFSSKEEVLNFVDNFDGKDYRFHNEIKEKTKKKILSVYQRYQIPDSDDNFFKLQCPVFLAYYDNYERKIKIEKWPVLKDINFQKIKDPFTCFQEINQYAFGVLGCNEKDVAQVGEKDRYEQRGFDQKYGFRKRPKS